MKHQTAVLLLAGLLLAPSWVQAEPKAPQPSAVDPLETTWLPIRGLHPRSRISHQLVFTRATQTFMRGVSGSLNVVGLALDFRYALLNRLQFRLNVPYLSHASTDLLGGRASTEFGNISFEVLGKVLETAGKLRFVLSPYFGATFLTTSVNVNSRSVAGLEPGLSFGIHFARFTALMNLGFFWVAHDGQDLGLFCWALNLGVSLHRMISAVIGFQLAAPFHPQSGDVAAALTAGIRFNPLRRFFMELGTRIAFNDPGKAFYASLGTALLLFNGGYNFSGIGSR